MEKWKDYNQYKYGVNFYKNVINVLTIKDPLKRKTAKYNNLNWIEFFNMKQFNEWFIKKIKRYQKIPFNFFYLNLRITN